MTTFSLQGVGVSRGIAIGRVHVIERNQQEISEYHVNEEDIQEEIARFKRALLQARKQLRSIRKHIPPDTPKNVASFIDTYLLMLRDPALKKEPIKIIRKLQCNAEWALKLQRDALIAVFDEMEDEYLRTRKEDIEYVVNRVQRILTDQDVRVHEEPDSQMDGYIVLADDLSPADTVLMQHKKIAAFVIEHGGPTSHTAILARSLGIPSVVGLRRGSRYISEGDMLIVDANQGVVLVNPDEMITANYLQQYVEEIHHQEELIELKEAEAITQDGIKINLQANIELEKDFQTVEKVGAKAVGLYRTEHLYMNRNTAPTEDEHYDIYSEVMKSVGNIPLTLRTMDIGADKTIINTDEETIPLLANPALGLRAVRLCLKEPILFEPQLRAILRVSAEYPIRVMIPMLSNIQEIREVLTIIEEIKKEFLCNSIPFNTELKIGGMIEVPAAAICADHFAKHLDFLSIGTNDLIQYAMAIDRVNDEVNYLYDPLNPAVLKLIHMTIKAGQEQNIPVAMCGEMAGEPRFVKLLLGLGLREFSVHPASLLEIKQIINQSKINQLESAALNILNADDSLQANEMLEVLNQ
ncbi:MAG: phosphoenolpyruvate--protein phosphotransferase [Gammaproteobacteria bacterium]